LVEVFGDDGLVQTGVKKSSEIKEESQSVKETVNWETTYFYIIFSSQKGNNSNRY
jgi:hypothetical protein